MNTWDKRWMDMCVLVASWSKDASRKTSAVIVDYRNSLLSIGWNGFPRGVCDDAPDRNSRPAKYSWTEHAERNAIYNAAANGIAIKGATMYMPWYPCADCARAVIQSGIAELVCVEPDWDDGVWADDFAVVKVMLSEASCMVVRFIDDMEPPKKGEG
jgi:dCMP deaminase